ncbi:MAG: DUF6242 domain-containing protein [Bacteroidales bacterium]|nr:DUF6242 domain-containing protein [Bacteroidales bacterium]
MNRHVPYLLSVLVVLTSLTFTSCLSDDDTDIIDYSEYNDCIVSNVVLGTLYRQVTTTTPAGRDSTYTTTVTGSYYPMHIDHLNARIFNTDSLPAGTNPKKILFSSFSTSGATTLVSATTGEDTLFSLRDTLDCSTVRYIKVHAYDGVSVRRYALHINIHREDGNVFRWDTNTVAAGLLAGMEPGLRMAVRADSVPVIFGRKDDTLIAVAAPRRQEPLTAILPQGMRPESIVTTPDGSRMYGLAAEGLMTSADGMAWTAVATDVVPQALLLCGSRTLVGMGAEGFIASTDGGRTWVAEAADEPHRLPAAEMVGAMLPSRTDSRLEDFVVIGRDADGQTVVWRRTDDLTGSASFNWYYLPQTDAADMQMPRLKAMTLVAYDESLLLFGQQENGTAAPIYTTRDYGRTWQPSDIEALPFATGSTNGIAAAVGTDHFIHVTETATGRLWRGRHNRLGWAEAQ